MKLFKVTIFLLFFLNNSFGIKENLNQKNVRNKEKTEKKLKEI
jgi:hypothetical protein